MNIIEQQEKALMEIVKLINNFNALGNLARKNMAHIGQNICNIYNAMFGAVKAELTTSFVIKSKAKGGE